MFCNSVIVITVNLLSLSLFSVVTWHIVSALLLYININFVQKIKCVCLFQSLLTCVIVFFLLFRVPMLSQWCHSLLAWRPLLEGEWGTQEPSLPEAKGVPKRRSPLCSRLESSSACLQLSWAAPCTRWDRFFFSVWAVTQRQSHHRAVTSCFTSLNDQCCFWFCKLKHAESKTLKKTLLVKKKKKNYFSS